MDYLSFEELKQRMEAAERTLDFDKIKEAYDLAVQAHEGQKRISGEPYIIHPIEVAGILAELGMDSDCICAGLLHDVVEYTAVTV